MAMATRKLERRAPLRDIPIDKMAVADLAQRRLSTDWVNILAQQFDIDEMGTPVVSERDGKFYILDGQHRIEALKLWLGVNQWQGQKISCACYSGLNLQQEADIFLKLNNRRTVTTFDKFKTAVTAGRDPEIKVYKIVTKHGLQVTRGNGRGVQGGISAVGALVKVYTRFGKEELDRSLGIIKDSFGDAGFESNVIEGLGALCHRYNGALDDGRAILKLGQMRGGVKGLINRGQELRLRTGNSLALCIAAASVDVINSGSGKGKRLASWWKADTEAA